MKWLARRFKYTRQIEEELETYREDWAKLLNRLSKKDQEDFLTRTGWAMPDEFGWDPDGYVKYREEIETKKKQRLGSRLKPDLV